MLTGQEPPSPATAHARQLNVYFLPDLDLRLRNIRNTLKIYNTYREIGLPTSRQDKPSVLGNINVL